MFKRAAVQPLHKHCRMNTINSLHIFIVNHCWVYGEPRNQAIFLGTAQSEAVLEEVGFLSDDLSADG